MAATMTATATNVPATLPGLDQNPFALEAAAWEMTVCVSCGGSDGVTVNVWTCPVTVSTVTTGVGDHVEDDDEVVEVEEVVGVDVDVSNGIETGMYLDVVDDVCAIVEGV